MDNIIEIPYEPRPLQAELHDKLDKYRFGVIICHRRWGKTLLAVNHLIRFALMCPLPNPRVAYIAPTYRQAKMVAFDYCKQFASPIPGVKFHEGELRVDFPNGGRLQLLGSESPASLRGIYLDLCFMDEFSQMPSSLFPEVIRPALADRHMLDKNSGRAVFMGTPMGRNNFYDLYMMAKKTKGWTTALYKASETKVLSQSELDAAKSMMSEDQYEQEFECSWNAAIVGSYYGNSIENAEKDNRITMVSYDPHLPVHVAWDLGISDSCALWLFQVTETKRINVIDFYEHWGVGLEHYVKVLEEKGYWYGDDYLPHDARVRELGTGRTRAETMVNMGRRVRIVPNHKVMDGINAARLLLDRCYIDAGKCEQGLNMLRAYQREWDDKQRVFKKTPLHNFASHAADSFRYLAMAYKNLRPEEKQGGKPKSEWPTLDEMLSIHDKEQMNMGEPRI